MATRPNVVFITIDAWRYDALSFASDKHWLERYGLVSKLHTPNLDSFVSEGVYFTQTLATAPHTTSSHASIMTGLFPPQHGVRSFFYERLPDDVQTLAQVLGSYGYVTVTLREAEDTSQPGILQKVDVLRGFDTFVHDLKQLVIIAQQAAGSGRPVFAFLHLWDLHAPYLYSNWARQAGILAALGRKIQSLAEQWHVEPPAPGDISEHKTMDFQQKVADRIRDVDLRIKTLFEWYIDGVNWFDQHRWPEVETVLKSGRLWDNTAIFVFGDHGEGIHPDGHGVHVFDHGQSLLDDQLRVPLVVRGLPGAASILIDEQVSLVDLAPTVLDMLAIDPSERLGINSQVPPCGHSLLPALSNPSHAGPVPLHFAELCRGGPDFTLACPSRQYLHQSCVRGGGYKLIYHREPVLMKRYLSWSDRQWRLGRKLGLPIGKAQEMKLLPDRTDDGRLYWTELRMDPDETQPRHWNWRVPAAVVDLRARLEKMYQTATRGPDLALQGFDESAVLQRLAALGYVEQ